MKIRNKLHITFIGIALLVPLIGAMSLVLYWKAAETAAITEATNIATTLAEYVASEGGKDQFFNTRAQRGIQNFVLNLHAHLNRDFEVVDAKSQIIADVVDEDIGTKADFEEAEKTLKDGMTRPFVEISKDYPEGIKQIVVPIRLTSGKIEGAVILEYTPLYRELVAAVREGATIIVLASILALVSAIFLGGFFSKSFTTPIIRLKEAAQDLAQGQLNTRINQTSKDEVGELTASFNTMAANLLAAKEELVHKEKLAVLGQVAGSVGHELRNPLGVMSNAVFYLRNVLPETNETIKEYLDIIGNEIAGSERIVSDLLDSVRTKPPHPEAAAVRELIERTMGKCTVPASISVVLDIPATLPPLQVDAMQIHQVLRNLIGNAVEAMPGGGTLQISASSDEALGKIVISVRDSGVGIAPENLAKVFQPLFTTKARGIGLGLVVVKNLTEANGGRVQVQSEPGKGAVFSVTLPARGPAMAPA